METFSQFLPQDVAFSIHFLPQDVAFSIPLLPGAALRRNWTFSALLALCAENSPVTGEFPSQRPVTRSSDVSFDLRLNKHSSKQSRGWWFETPSCSLWRHRNAWSVRIIIHIWKVQNQHVQNTPLVNMLIIFLIFQVVVSIHCCVIRAWMGLVLKFHKT